MDLGFTDKNDGDEIPCSPKGSNWPAFTTFRKLKC